MVGFRGSSCSDATLYGLLLLDLGVALLALAQPRTTPGRVRPMTFAGVLAASCVVALAYGGVRIEEAVAGRQLKSPRFDDYVDGLRRSAADRVLTLEGKASVVSVYAKPEVPCCARHAWAGLGARRPRCPSRRRWASGPMRSRRIPVTRW